MSTTPSVSAREVFTVKDNPLMMEIELIPRGAGLRYVIDLHWGLLGGDPRSYGATEELWAAARPSTVLGVEAWAMSPEWALLFLVLHAARSQPGGRGDRSIVC